MKYLIKEYVERLKRFSHRLDNFSLLVDQPWVTNIDEKRRCVFIFRKKNNELLMSVEGRIEKAKWEYIESMNSLIIERASESILYNQGFFNESLLILKKDGTSDFQLFVNENKLEGGVDILLESIERELLISESPEKEIRKKRHILETLSDGRQIEIITELRAGYTIGDNVLVNGQKAEDGYYRYGWMNGITVENGKISKLSK